MESHGAGANPFTICVATSPVTFVNFDISGLMLSPRFSLQRQGSATSSLCPLSLMRIDSCTKHPASNSVFRRPAFRTRAFIDLNTTNQTPSRCVSF